MTNATVVGWRKVTVRAVNNFAIEKATGRKNFLKFIVDVAESGIKNAYTASMLVEPTLIPGRSLFQWLRVCNIPLTEVDDKIRSAQFVGKEVHAKIVTDGQFYNIIDIRQLPTK